MSVAFRREGDDEHKEPKFEQPIAPGPNLVTVRGLEQIEARIEALAGELDGETDEARRDGLKRDLRYWRTRRATAEIATAPEDGSVGIGSIVTVRSTGGDRTITIVGGDEAEPAKGLIGWQAPIARALLAAIVGDEVAFAGGTLEIVAVDRRDNVER